MHAFTSNWVTVTSSWPGVQACVRAVRFSGGGQ